MIFSYGYADNRELGTQSMFSVRARKPDAPCTGNRSYTAFPSRAQAFRRPPCKRPANAFPFAGEGVGSNPQMSAGQLGRIRRSLA